MARSAVLAGRTMADLTRNLFVVALMAAVGFAVGFRVHTGAPQFVGGLALVLLFGYVFSWVFATVGLWVRDPEAAQAAAFPVMAPLVFASSAFVPVSSMPGWLRVFAEHQPVSVTASAVRALMLGGSATSDVLQALAWSAGILLVFAAAGRLALSADGVETQRPPRPHPRAPLEAPLRRIDPASRGTTCGCCQRMRQNTTARQPPPSVDRVQRNGIIG